MNKCTFCSAELPPNGSFCSICGRLQNDSSFLTDRVELSVGDETFLSNKAVPDNLPPSPSLTPTELPLISSEEEEEKKHVLILPLAIPSGNELAGGAPMVSGTPHLGNAPMVPGTLHSGGGVGGSAPVMQSTAPMHLPSPASTPSTHLPPPASTPPAPMHLSSPTSPPSNPVPTGPLPNQDGNAPPIHHTHHIHHRTGSIIKVAGMSITKVIIIAIVTFVVVASAGSALAVYFFTRPQPVLSVSSAYRIGSTLVGAPNTTLHISGQKFTGNSLITFLLDGSPAPGNPAVQSDANGNITTNLTITSGWHIGRHTLTARDAENYSTKTGIAIIIVRAGEAHTPGPPSASPTTDPIVGDWNVTYGAPAVVTISGSGGTYTITAKSPVRVTGSSCDLPPGTIIATFSGSGNSYSGQHGLWYTTNCSFARWTSLSLTLNGSTLTGLGGGVESITFTRSRTQ